VKCIIALLILACFVSLSFGQYVETTVLLPDSVSALDEARSLVFHSPTNTIYVGGSDYYLVAVDASTNSKLRRMTVGTGPHLLCSDPVGNKVYCANYDGTVTVIDAATNQPLRTIPLGRRLTDLVFNGAENKLYCGNSGDSLVRVIDCAADSVVALVPVSFGPVALCYNPQLNRIYCAHEDRDEVTVVDCAADTMIAAVWVRGVEPLDVCYDSATNCAYVANGVSNTVSVIDCAADTIVRLVPVGRAPRCLVGGPPGKVYCASDDRTVSAISTSGVKTVETGHYPTALSFDPVNNKVYCAGIYQGWVTVIDAGQDTVLADVVTGYPLALCYNPAGNNTYVACHYDDVVEVIDGAADTVEAVITFMVCSPGPLCYNTTNNHLYCLDQGNHTLYIIDGNSNRVLKTLNTRSTYGDALIWNSVSNKVYVTNSGDGTISILDCTSDSFTATLNRACGWLCCGDNGKVYVAIDSGVAVIDGSGDTIRAVVPIPAGYYCLYPYCYDRTDKKLYVGAAYEGDTAVIRVIDSEDDSVRASIAVSDPYGYEYDMAFCWSPNHDKLYVGRVATDTFTVIDCAGDTVLRNALLPSGINAIYNDSVCDKVYCADEWTGLVVIRADLYYTHLNAGYVTALLDNGKQGPANRLYCIDTAGSVTVVGGYKTDSILCRIGVGNRPFALAWNPAHSRMYVSNYGSSSITVIRDTFGVGVEERQLQASSHKPQATVARGVLFLNGLGTRSGLSDNPVMSRAALLDAVGRRVMDLKPGANDVRALAPGVYFVREEPQAASNKPRAVRKVIVTAR